MIRKLIAALLFCCMALPAAAEIRPLGLDEAANPVDERYYTSATHYEDPSLTVDVYLDGRIHETNYAYAVIKIADCLREIDDKLTDYDIVTAYNMDGGGSTTMVFHNEKINSPTNPKIRSLSDIIYFVSAWNNEE